MKAITRTCLECEQEFQTSAHRIKNGEGKFCSHSCAMQFRNRVSGHALIVKVCPECDKEFKAHPYAIKNGNGKYCSRECSSKVARRERRKNVEERWEHLNLPRPDSNSMQIPLTCEECGQQFLVKSSWHATRRKYCSNLCAGLAHGRTRTATAQRHKKEKARTRALKQNYDLTQQQVNELLQLQEGKCAICKDEFLETAHVDHDHQTNTVRGLLCGRCNTGVGLFHDSISILKNAIEYLERFEEDS